MLEELLKKLIEAVEANTAALAGGAAPAPAKASGTKASGTKATNNKKPKDGPTLDEIKEKFGGYLANQKGAEKAKRMAQVQSINEFFEVERASMLPEDKYAEALGYLQSYMDGETPDFDGAVSVEDDESPV